MGQLHYSSDWWEYQYYQDALAKAVKVRRLMWMLAWGAFVSWMPYFIGNSWRMFILRMFGLKESGGNVVHPSAKVWAPWNVQFGTSVAIDDNVNLYSVAAITIGTKVAISRNAFLCTASHDISKPNIPLVTKPIVISDGVWICANAIILPGVTIGEGAIVAAGSVVTKDVPCWAVVAGNPAQVVKMRELTNVNGSGFEDRQ